MLFFIIITIIIIIIIIIIILFIVYVIFIVTGYIRNWSVVSVWSVISDIIKEYCKFRFKILDLINFR